MSPNPDETLAAPAEAPCVATPAAAGAHLERARALAAQGRLDEALVHYRDAAEAGHGIAQIECARMALDGLAAPAEAVRWLERAERQGYPVAGYYLALIALGSVALPRDGRINQRVLAAVQADFPPAIRAAAVHFGRRDNPRDQDLCIQLLARGTNLGDVVCAQLLVERLARGEGCRAQPEAAAGLRAQLAAVGAAALPAVTAAIPPVIYPLRESGLVEPGTIALEDALQAAPMQALSQAPRVMQVDTLLSADECRLLIATASRQAAPARAGAGCAGPDGPRPMPAEPQAEDLALRLVQLRIARTARMELAHAGALAVALHGPGVDAPAGATASARPTRPDPQADGGSLVRTVHVFLGDATGDSVPGVSLAGVSLEPRAGRAVMVDHAHADACAGNRGASTELVIRHGEHWVATLGLRERRCRLY